MTQQLTPELEQLHRGFDEALLVPLWTEIGDLMSVHPRSRAVPHVWRWARLLELAEQAGHLVPVGRGGECRAIALANPALGGKPYAMPTLWAAIQYLMPGVDAPEHRHTQHAFRFVVEGEGVWTVVGRDPVPMRRGDFLPQAGWWQPLSVRSEASGSDSDSGALDLFRFSDAPIFEALHLERVSDERAAW